MSEGWISIHRKIQDSAIWTNPDMLKLWLLCLMKASFKDQPNFVFDGKVVPLATGEFVTGRKVLAAEYNRGMTSKYTVSESTIERWLKKFENMQMLNIKKTTKYSVVTVINWQSYQSDEQRMNITCTTDEQRVNTKNNYNNKPEEEEIYINDAVKNEYNKTFPETPMNEYIAQSIAAWINVFDGDIDIIIFAFTNAAEYSAKNFKYVERMLKTWEECGVKTLGNAKAYVDNFKKHKEIEQSVRQSTVPLPKELSEKLPKVPMYNWLGGK